MTRSFPLARFRLTASLCRMAGLVALAFASSSGCNGGISDSSALNLCAPVMVAYPCTCLGGGQGFAYCLVDGTIEKECRCDGTMPDYPDGSVLDAGPFPAETDAGNVSDASTP
jgi:hypothetical protein